MPSSHSSLVATLTTFIALTEGAATPVFGLALIFAFVTIYDACGVRYAAGQQAKILNQILLNLATDDPKVRDARLKEFLGHTKVEVIAGCILGIFIALAYYALFIR